MSRGQGGWTKCPCDNCQQDNCGRCSPCLSKKRFGGDGKRSRRCVERYCLLDPKQREKAFKQQPPQQKAQLSDTNTTDASPPPPPSLQERAVVTTKKMDNIGGSGSVEVARPTAKRPPKEEEKAPAAAAAAAAAKQSHKPKRIRCGKCPACLAPDCRECIYCKAKKKYGGDGTNPKSHSSCIQRNCHVLYPRILPNGLRGRAKPDTSSEQTRKRKKRRFVGEYSNNNNNNNNSSRSETNESTSFAAAGSAMEASKNEGDFSNNDDGEEEEEPAKRTTRSRRAKTAAAAATSSSMDAGGDDSMDDDTFDSGIESGGGGGEARVSSAVPFAYSANNYASVPGDEPQSLTQYLLEQPPVASTRQMVKKDHQDVRKSPPYGLEEPDEPAPNVCSECRGARNDELEGQPVLLCDGQGCDREYHLACTVPSLSQVPPETDHWLCQDCCPEGSTATLRQYLEAADAAKAEFFSEHEGATEGDYILHLWRKDTQEANAEDDSNHRYPESELARGGMTHSLALCDCKSLARTRRGNEIREPLPAESYLGKPARLYSSIGNQYHTGRIVDYRMSVPLASEDVPSNSNNNNTTEFLVRFPAGKDDRKTALQHWIVLEEHSLAVGSSLVWAQIPPGNWTPAILWLRTARELIPVQHLLNEAEGEIVFKNFKTEVSSASKKELSPPSKTKHKVFSLARTFGTPELFSLINVRDQCVDLYDADGTVPKKSLEDPEKVLRLQVAKAEGEEQQRVRSFRPLKKLKPFSPFALSSRDAYTLPPLAFDDSDKQEVHGRQPSLCPNVRHGLDRAKIAKMLRRRGVTPSKDMISSLSCEIVPVTSKTMTLNKT